VDDDDTVFITDTWNERIVAWKQGDNERHIVAGGQRQECGSQQLNCPTDVLIGNETNSVIIRDWEIRRLVRWPLKYGTRGELLVDNITCYGLAIDK
jgi:hypothetical protein